MNRFYTFGADIANPETVTDTQYKMQVDGTRTWLAKLGINAANNPQGVVPSYIQAWQTLYNSLRYPGLALTITNLIGGSPLVAGDPIGQFVIIPIKKGKFLDKANAMYRSGEGYLVVELALANNTQRPDLFDLSDPRFKNTNLNSILLKNQEMSSDELNGVFQIDASNSVPISFPNLTYMKATGPKTLNINGIQYYLQVGQQQFDKQPGDILNPDFANDYTVFNQYTFVIWTDNYTYGPILKPLPLGDAWWQKYEPKNNPYRNPQPATITPAPAPVAPKPVPSPSTIPQPAPSTIKAPTPVTPAPKPVTPAPTPISPSPFRMPSIFDMEAEGFEPTPTAKPVTPPIGTQPTPPPVVPVAPPVAPPPALIVPPKPAPIQPLPAPGPSTIIIPGTSSIPQTQPKAHVEYGEDTQEPTKDLNYFHFDLTYPLPLYEEGFEKKRIPIPQARTRSTAYSTPGEMSEGAWRWHNVTYPQLHEKFLQRKREEKVKVEYEKPKTKPWGVALLVGALTTGIGLSYYYGKK